MSPKVWLLLGVLALPLVGMRFNVALLAWVVAVPFLIYLRQTDGWRSRLLFLGALQLAVGVQILTIITAPIPWFFAPLFSVPMALSAGVIYLVFEALRRRVGDAVGLWLLPAMAVVSEWVGWRTSDLGSWGAMAYTQLDNLALLQIVSVFGLSGIAALIFAVAGWITVVLSSPRPTRWLPHGVVIAALVLGAHLYGVARLSTAQQAETVTVAGVVTDLALSPAGLPAPEVLDANVETLFERSHLAAERGAQVVVWNEGATAVHADEEAALLDRGRAFSTSSGVDLVLAYIVPHSRDTMVPYQNKYVWMTPEGPVQTYLKHHPVPGEGAVRGTDPIQVLERPYGRVAGAICYDYDFPALGQKHAALGAELVVVPSSDWRGIDPYHTKMATVRGIEGGFAVLRPVRWATSMATDAYGRVRGSLSAFEDNDRVLIAQVPTARIVTLYSRIGDVLPWASLLGIVWAAALAWRRRRATAP